MGKLIDFERFGRFLVRLGVKLSKLFSKSDKIGADVKTWLDLLEDLKAGKIPSVEQVAMLKGILGWTDDVLGNIPTILEDIENIKKAFSDLPDDLKDIEAVIDSIKEGNMPTSEQIAVLTSFVAECKEDFKTVRKLIEDL